MVKINLSRPIRLQMDVELSKAVEQSHGLTGVLDLPAGVQEVEDAVATHWFVAAHCEPLPEDAPQEQGSQGEADQGGDQGGEQGGEDTAFATKKGAKKSAE